MRRSLLIVLLAAVPASAWDELPAQALSCRARDGMSAGQQLSSLSDSDLDEATSLVALDLFFWDAYRGCVGTWAAVDRLFSRPLPAVVVIGNVPALPFARVLGGSSAAPDCRPRLNELLRERCAARHGCVLVDLDAMQRELDDGRIGASRRCGRADLMADWLHPNPAGSALIASRILSAVESADF